MVRPKTATTLDEWNALAAAGVLVHDTNAEEVRQKLEGAVRLLDHDREWAGLCYARTTVLDYIKAELTAAVDLL